MPSEVSLDAEYGEDNLAVDESLKFNDVTFIPPGIEPDGVNTKIDNAKIKKSIVQIGDVFVFNNIGTDEKSDNMGKLPDVIDKIHQMNGHVIANREPSINGKWPKLLKYTILKYTLIVAFGIILACGIIFSIVYLLMSNKEKDSSIPCKDDIPASSFWEVFVGRGYWFAQPNVNLLNHTKIQHDLIGVFVEAFNDCFTDNGCRSTVREYQGFAFSQNMTDIPANFVIGGDGRIYEGTGWDKYSYLNGDTKDTLKKDCSLIISILLNESNITIRMLSSFKLLLKRGIEIKKISPNAKIYDRRKVKYIFQYDDQTWDYNTSFRLVTRKEWGAVKIDTKPRMLAVNPAKLVIISHTAGEKCLSFPECSVEVRNIQALHIQKDYGDIGYNFLLGGDGNVYVGRGWGFEGAHTKYYNNISIGICFIGDFVSEEPTKKQIQAGFDLIQNGLSDGKITANYELYGHKQLINTVSPGDKVMEIIQKWPHWSTKS